MQEIAACSHEKTAALFKAAVLRDPAGLLTKRYFFLNISTFRNFGFASVTL